MRTLWIALLLAGSVLSAGCLGAIPRRVPMVLVEDDIVVSGEGRDMANFGPHCANLEFDRHAPSAKLTMHDGDMPAGLLVRDFGDTWRVPQGASFSTTGLSAHLLDHVPAGVPLKSPFLKGPTLANLTIEEDRLVVDGEVLAPGESWNATFRYAFDAEGGPIVVEETVRVTHLGQGWLRAPPSFGACA